MTFFHNMNNVGETTPWSSGLMRHYVTETTNNGNTDVVGYFFHREKAKAFANQMNECRSTKRDGIKYVAHTDHPKY